MQTLYFPEFILVVKRSITPPIVVVDVDGVLVESGLREEEARRQAGSSKRRFWELFLSERYTHLDIPGLLAAYIRRLRDRGYTIVVVTGRPERMLHETIRQLSEYGIPWDAIATRREGVYLRDDELKRRILEWLRTAYGRVELVIDDSERVREAAEKMGIPALSPEEAISMLRG